MPYAFIFKLLSVNCRLEHDTEAKVKKVDFVPFKVLPHGACLIVIFRIDGAGRTVHPVNTGCFRVKLKPSVSAITCCSAGFHPLIRIGIHQPAVAIGRYIGIHIKVVGNGKVAGNFKVVYHHICILHRVGSGAVGKRGIASVACQPGIALPFFNLPENFVIRTVFLRNKNNVFNRTLLFARVKRHRIVFAPVEFFGRGFIEIEIVGNYLFGLIFKFFIGRDIQNLNCTFHQCANIAAFGAPLKGISSVGAASKTFGVGNYQFFSVTAYLQFCRKPAGGNVSQNFQIYGIDNSYCIDSRAGNIKPLVVGRQRQSKRNDPAELFHPAVGFQINGVHHRIFFDR